MSFLDLTIELHHLVPWQSAHRGQLFIKARVKVIVTFFFLVWFCFEIGTCYVAPTGLALTRPDWSRTHGVLAIFSQVFGLPVCTTTAAISQGNIYLLIFSLYSFPLGILIYPKNHCCRPCGWGREQYKAGSRSGHL